jgi:hypothetical protein
MGPAERKGASGVPPDARHNLLRPYSLSGQHFSHGSFSPVSGQTNASAGAAQHDPAPGQQQLPVAQQLSAFTNDLAAAPVARWAGSQHAPWPGQQQSPVTQHPAAVGSGAASARPAAT